MAEGLSATLVVAGKLEPLKIGCDDLMFPITKAIPGFGAVVGVMACKARGNECTPANIEALGSRTLSTAADSALGSASDLFRKAFEAMTIVAD